MLEAACRCWSSTSSFSDLTSTISSAHSTPTCRGTQNSEPSSARRRIILPGCGCCSSLPSCCPLVLPLSSCVFVASASTRGGVVCVESSSLCAFSSAAVVSWCCVFWLLGAALAVVLWRMCNICSLRSITSKGCTLQLVAFTKVPSSSERVWLYKVLRSVRSQQPLGYPVQLSKQRPLSL